jgi:hypothetical protein
MKLTEIISRKDAENRFQQLLAPREPRSISVPSSNIKSHIIKKSSKPVNQPEDTFAINRRLDRKLKTINQLREKLNLLKPRVLSMAKEFGHQLPQDFLKVDDNRYLYLDQDRPDSRSMEQRHDDLIQAYQNKLNQIKMYLKYPQRYRYN